jgi:3-phenylpropionate/cinnamic acid dioxygenase small subunit
MQHWPDIFEIRDVIDRYATAIDQRDWELLRSCFAEDCEADYGRSGRWTGRSPLVAWLEEIHRDVGPTQHRITNHRVTLDGDCAGAVSYFDALLLVEHREHDLLQVTGSYTDELRRTAGGWQIASRRCDTLLWRRGNTRTVA